MSRCFPFPPPGYERKICTDDLDLLKKEKNRERKHKKEKKDKERKQGKESREKEKSDGEHSKKKERDKKEKKDKEKREGEETTQKDKSDGEHREKKDREKREGDETRQKDKSDGEHRDKKDRKKKNRDKKKEKEKDRDKSKEKARIPGEKRVTRQYENYEEQRLYQEENQDKDGSFSNEKKETMQFRGYNKEKPVKNSLLSEQTDDFRFLQELDRRIKDEKNNAGSQSVERFAGGDPRKEEGMGKLVEKNTVHLVEGKEANKGRRVDNRKMDGRGIWPETEYSGIAMAQNIIGIVQNGIKGMPRPTERNIETRMEGKEKSKEKEANDKRGVKRKDKNGVEKSQTKDKDLEKEKKKAEKVKEKSENKFVAQDKVKDSKKNGLIDTAHIRNLHLHKESDVTAAAEGNINKRNNLGTNGFSHTDDVRPIKKPRPTSHSSTENGRKLEPCQSSVLFTSDRHATANGIKELPPSVSISSMEPLSAVMQVDQIAEASRKPPHRDSKYLSKVLSVPKMEEWLDFDDQEWLFSSNILPSKKPDVGSVGVNNTSCVWAEPLKIESADVFALPYVIPY